ncbi:MAG TPA: OmpA family protein [Saprospiraceae bacterium]|nr:OmpA family protein [Saprospiraceae bacterium]
MKNITLVFLISCFATALFAQSAKLNRAASLMEELNYSEAIELYGEILEEEDNSEAKMQLAKAYRLTNDTKNAEYWYGQVVRLLESKSEHKLFYGQMLQTNGKCDLAKYWYKKYVSEQPGDHRGQLLLASCDAKEELMQKNAGIFDVNNMSINSASDDFGARYYEDGIIFSSDRDKGVAVKRVHTWTNRPFLELFYAEFEKSKRKVKGEKEDPSQYCQELRTESSEKFNKDINSKFHDALVSISPDGNSMMFTRNNIFEGKVGSSEDDVVKLKIYESKKEEEEWSDLISLPFNSDEYNVTHPAYSADGKKLFFASDMPGGFGGMDLYVSHKEGGRWGPPFNLGPLVNTEGNELFPFYGQNGHLFFSSNGQIGLGGLDVYSIEDLGDNQWGEVVNLGAPINSTYDDFAITFREDMKVGFISSNRSGGKGGDDIYCFTKNASPAEIFVYDKGTGEPIAGAKINNECTGLNYMADEEGLISLDIPNDTCCTFFASKEMYVDQTKRHCTVAFEENRIEIGLNKAFDCFVEGNVFDKNTGLPLERVKVSAQNSCDKSNPPSVYTDSSGYYRLDLSASCCFTLIAELDDYMMNPMSEKCSDCKTESSALTADIFLNPTRVTSDTDKNIVSAPDLDDNPFGADSNDLISQPQAEEQGKEDVTDKGRIVKDEESGLYVYEKTGEPANEDNEAGVSYVDGERFYQGRKIQSEEEEGFETSPGTDAEIGAPIAFLLHIYYDFDESYIRDSEVEDLKKLCRLMKQNPEMVVEISSHTDARGSKAYNRRLSQRRADTVVDWMVNNCGIEAYRLIPRGYGESQPVNDCLNAIRCSEESHQLNRRTEFRVINCEGKLEFKYSKPKENPEVDPCPNCSF